MGQASVRPAPRAAYEDGRIVGVGGIAVDASKRRAAEQALPESEARVRTLVERLPVCTYINPLGQPIRTTYMSPHVEKLLGFPVVRWLNAPDFFVTKTGEAFRQSYRLIAKDGRVVHLLDETIPVSDERGRPLFLQGFFIELDSVAEDEAQSATG